MRTEVMFDYKYKIFSSESLKQFALKLAKFCDMPAPEGRIFLHRREDGFETSTQSTIDKFNTNLEIGTTTPESLGFHYKGHIIVLSLKNEYENIHVTYILDCDIEYSKKLIFFIENTLSLTRLSEQEASVAILDGYQSIEQTQMDSDHGKVLQKNESTDLLIDVWQKASKQLQSLYSAAAYETWIAPIVPSVDGNKLILNCPNELAKDWLESRYNKAIIETVLSINSTVEGIIVKFSDKETNLSNETTNNQFLLEIDEPLYEFMMRVYEKEIKNSEGWTFEKYFKQVIQSHCQDRMDTREHERN